MRTKIQFLIVLCCLFSVSVIAQDSESIVVVVQDDLSAYWIATTREDPRYPRVAFNNGKQGCAVIAFVIDSDGTTSNHKVLFSYPDAAFNRAAINAYKHWRFEPADSNTTRAAVYTSMTATFTWVDKELNDPDARQTMDSLCSEEGDRALQKMVRSAAQ